MEAITGLQRDRDMGPDSRPSVTPTPETSTPNVNATQKTLDASVVAPTEAQIPMTDQALEMAPTCEDEEDEATDEQMQEATDKLRHVSG